MKGDFSRFSYNDRKHYSLILMQQGRVQLDADWNEQAIVHWFNLQNLAEDLIGEHGGPGESFKIEQRTGKDGSIVPFDFKIKQGRYYVRGSMCQNDTDSFFTDQEDYFPISAEMTESGTYLVYLYLWWRHITSEEDESIREVALEGPDTATRLKVVWQVKVMKIEGEDLKLDLKKDYAEFEGLLKEKDILKRGTGVIQAQSKTSTDPTEPCITEPANRYRGAENQLYRVEIHRSGLACYGDNIKNCATFKWSRENGSVVFPILEMGENTVILAHLGRDPRFGLKIGDWVEVVDDIYELQRRAENLLKVTAVDPNTMEVTLSGTPQLGRILTLEHPSKNPMLRRWDHASDVPEGTVLVTQNEWLELEDGVQIRFTIPAANNANPYWYQSGDWWWVAARTATGDVEWPRDINNDEPIAQEALDHGDRFAPLALIEIDSSGKISIKKVKDYRRVIKKLWQ